MSTTAGGGAGSVGTGARRAEADAEPETADATPADAATHGPPASPSDSAGEGGRSWRRSVGRRTWVAVAASVVVAALVLAVVALVRAPSEATLRDSALLAARTYSQSLTTFDARTLDEDAARVRRASTPAFVEEYDRTLEGLRESVEAQQTVSTGTVVGAGLERLDGGNATVLVAVDQQILGAGTPARTEANRLRMRLERRDGQWLIAGVERL